MGTAVVRVVAIRRSTSCPSSARGVPMPKLSYKSGRGKEVEFEYDALPHEEGGGFSYNLRMSAAKGDVVHIDTKRGTVFSDDDIKALHAFWTFVRARNNGSA
jgi:hypothetical protein